MTGQQFTRAAEIVKQILDGRQVDIPMWAMPLLSHTNTYAAPGVRAVQTAEAFIQLFTAFNDRFDQQRFLQACGLVEK